MYIQSELFQSCILTYLCLLLYSLPCLSLYVSVFGFIFTLSKALAPCLRITVWFNSRPFLSLASSSRVCVVGVRSVLYQRFLIVSSHRSGCVCPPSVALLWDQLLVFERARTKFSSHSHAQTRTLVPRPSSIHRIPDPSSSHAGSLSSTPLSARLFPSPSQPRPGASRDQCSQPPPLTAALCWATRWWPDG